MAEPFEVFIRVSALSGYSDCNRRAAANLFRSLIEAMGFHLRSLPSSIGAPVGTAVHAGAEMTLRHKFEHGDVGHENLPIEAAIAALDIEIDKGVMWDRETPERNTAQQQVVRMTRVYRDQVAPSIHPIKVEEQMQAQVMPGLVLTGRGDVTAREPGAVHDTKTGKSRGNHRPQIGGYSLLNRSLGLDINRAFVDFIQRVSLKKPQPDAIIEEIPIALAETAAVNVIRTIHADLRTFTDGDPSRHLLPGDPWAFLPNPSSKICGSKYCVAHGTDFCREHEQVEETE